MKTLTLAAAVLGAATLLTGCGGDDDSGNGGGSKSSSSFTDQSGAEIAEAAKDAMAGLESVRVSGSISSDGEEIALDLAVSTAGECAGSVSVGGASAELLGADGTAWFKPSDEFWLAQGGEQAQTIIDLVAGRWVVMPAGDEGFGEFCDLDSLLEELVDNDEENTYEKGDVSEIDGTEAIAITNTDGEDGPSVGHVQVEGDHYLLKMERTEGDDQGAITFSDFDAEVPVEAPAAEDTVDLDELGS
ncbi:hypothetical protein [Nocardioides sp. W7]|uniref:hypothetical protein n=1 Tax=Nocardioides sp. W7 TaxID=2931390 RepID=UPI001FD4DBBB|nr:hypothetical protein [Nocardioides sp. W7]